jgi:hypothetical protein
MALFLVRSERQLRYRLSRPERGGSAILHSKKISYTIGVRTGKSLREIRCQVILNARAR